MTFKEEFSFFCPRLVPHEQQQQQKGLMPYQLQSYKHWIGKAQNDIWRCHQQESRALGSRQNSLTKNENTLKWQLGLQMAFQE